MALATRLAVSCSKLIHFKTQCNLKFPLRSKNFNGTQWRHFFNSAKLSKDALAKAEAPIAPVVKPKVKSEEFRRLLSIAEPEKYRLTGGIALLFASSAITMAIPFALGKVIDIIYSVNQETMVQNLTNVSLGLVGVFIIGAVCNFGRTYLMGVSGMKVANGMVFI